MSKNEPRIKAENPIEPDWKIWPKSKVGIALDIWN
jgi:hypothetical protein